MAITCEPPPHTPPHPPSVQVFDNSTHLPNKTQIPKILRQRLFIDNSLKPRAPLVAVSVFIFLSAKKGERLQDLTLEKEDDYGL